MSYKFNSMNTRYIQFVIFLLEDNIKEMLKKYWNWSLNPQIQRIFAQ